MRRVLPSLTALQFFESSARHLSFTRAAEELNVTQSAISRQIRALEEWFGLSLFDRTGRQIRLTETGARLLSPISAAFDGIANAVELVCEDAGRLMPCPCPRD